MKNKTVTVAGIEFDSRIFTAIDKKQFRDYLRYPYFNAQRGEVVATDGHIMLIQQVDAPESQKSGFVDYDLSEDSLDFAKYAHNEFYKGKTSNLFRYVISCETTYGAYPDYPRVIPDADAEKRVGTLRDFYADGWRLYYPEAVEILPDDTYKVRTTVYKKGFFVSNHHESAFDYRLFEKFYKFFDYPDDTDLFYTDSVSPLLAVSEKERKTAVVMPLRFDYMDEFVKIEGKTATRVHLE